jgi:hypothetical protein
MQLTNSPTKRLFLLVAAELALVVLLGYFLLANPPPPVLPSEGPLPVENYKRIQHGMTLAEVEAVLGPPSRNPPTFRGHPRDLPPDYSRTRWRFGDTEIDVVFDPAGKVSWARRGFDENKPR